MAAEFSNNLPIRESKNFTGLATAQGDSRVPTVAPVIRQPMLTEDAAVRVMCLCALFSEAVT